MAGHYGLHTDEVQAIEFKRGKDRKKRKKRGSALRTGAKAAAVAGLGVAGIAAAKRYGGAGVSGFKASKRSGSNFAGAGKAAVSRTGRKVARDVRSGASAVSNKAKSGAAYVKDRSSRAATDRDIRRKEREATVMTKKNRKPRSQKEAMRP